MKAQLTVTSEPGRGSTFTLHLPCADQRPGPGSSSPPALRSPASGSHRCCTSLRDGPRTSGRDATGQFLQDSNISMRVCGVACFCDRGLNHDCRGPESYPARDGRPPPPPRQTRVKSVVSCRDTSGGVLPGATVTATHPASGTVVERVTDGEGRFFLPALRIGQWEVTADAERLRAADEGDRSRDRAHARLWSSRSVLKVSHEQVTVEATAPLLQTANAEISDVIENREVVQMPLNGRNFLGLAQLSDAVVIPPGGTRGEALAAGRPAAERRRTAIGTQHLPARRHQGHRRALQQPRHQPVGRFDRGVQDPEIDVSGGIRRQGVGADQRRDEGRLEQRSTAASSSSIATTPSTRRTTSRRRASRFRRLRQNQFGGALGGPLVQNRTFFFASYEGQRMKRSLTRTFSVPSGGRSRRQFRGLRHRSAIR